MKSRTLKSETLSHCGRTPQFLNFKIEMQVIETKIRGIDLVEIKKIMFEVERVFYDVRRTLRGS